jgi:hypothetical protein
MPIDVALATLIIAARKPRRKDSGRDWGSILLIVRPKLKNYADYSIAGSLWRFLPLVGRLPCPLERILGAIRSK